MSVMEAWHGTVQAANLIEIRLGRAIVHFKSDISVYVFDLIGPPSTRWTATGGFQKSPMTFLAGSNRLEVA